MSDLLADYCARQRVPGVAVCTFDSDGPTSLACHGVTDVESTTPLRPATMFRIYSLSKLLTACLVVHLARRGLVDLDAPVGSYVHGLSRRGGTDGGIVTVRQALSHTSGLVPDSLTWARLGRNDADLERDIVRDYERAFSFAAPGRHYGYSNAGFNLAAVLVERLTSSSFAEAMRSLLFDPVGMPDTTHDPVVAMTYPLAQHHEVRDGEVRVIHRPLAGSKWLAGSQCFSTVTEMACFGSWLLRDLRSCPDVLPRVDRPIADLRLDIGTHYGLGCYLTPAHDGGTVVGHEGFFEGMWVKLAVDQAGDRGLLWMDNRGDEVRDARYEVIDQIMPGLLPAAGGRAEPVFATEAPTAIVGPAVAGLYQRLGSPSLRIEADGADLVLTHDGRRRRLRPFSRGIWRDLATTGDIGPWRPHAGSSHVCLGAAPRDSDGTEVVHLNAIPYRRDED